MKGKIIIPVLFLFLIFSVNNVYSQSVPDWVKNTAGWWATDAISETEFVNAIEFLIKENIIQTSFITKNQSSQSVPDWVKNTAGWWATDAISETEFVNAIEFLVKNGTINLKTDLGCITEFKEAFPNENNSTVIDLCANSEYTNELIPFSESDTVNSYGFKNTEFTKEKAHGIYRIFVVGGSTTWGSGNYSDETTIPGILQKIFDKQELNTNVEVINAGINGANSITESTLIKERLVNLDPDLIIMYDGWNDLRAEYPAETIHSNWKSTCQFGNENGFDVGIILQPIAGFANKSLSHQEYVNAITGTNHNNGQLLLQKNEYEKYANKLEELSTTCKITKDYRDVFDDVSGSIFWDQGHIADAGNMIIAERIYEISLPIIQKNLPKHTTFNDILKKYNNSIVISYMLQKYDVNIDNFKNTKLAEYPLESIPYFELKQKVGIENILVGKDLTDADLSTMNLVNQDLTGANLSGQDLRNIDLTGAILKSVDLTKSNLSGLNFTQRNLSGCILNETNVYETIFHYSQLSSCDISDTDFTNSSFFGTRIIGSTITESDFSGLRLIAVLFVESDISNTDFSDSDLSFSKIPSHLPHRIQIELVKFDMEPHEMEKLVYQKFDKLVNTILYQNQGIVPAFLLVGYEIMGEIVNVEYLVVNSFADANLNNVDFSNSDLTYASFAGATVSSIDLSDTKLDCVGHDMCLFGFSLTPDEFTKP